MRLELQKYLPPLAFLERVLETVPTMAILRQQSCNYFDTLICSILPFSLDACLRSLMALCSH